MANRGKHSLQSYITDFVVEIGFNADKERYNKSWDKLWKRIDKLGLFQKKNQKNL